MGLIGHWVAKDAGGAGTTLPDRSASAADGTLTAGCSWTTVSGEDAVACPAGEYVYIPDHARWDLGDFTMIARLVFNSLSGQPGFLSHSPGGGVQPKWIWNYNYPSGKTGLHWDGTQTLGGAAWSPSTGVIYALALKRSGSDFSFYRNKATDGTASNADAFDDASATLKLGYGGESFFDADVSIIALRIHNSAIADQDIYDAMDEDAGLVLRTPPAGALSLSGAMPSVEKSGERIPGGGALVLSGATASLLHASLRATGAGALALTGAAPSTLQQAMITPPAGALALAGAAPEVGGLSDFLHSLEFAPLINGGRFVYVHALSVLQMPLPDYAHELVVAGLLPDYAHTLRSVPDVDPLFSDDLQRTFAEAEVV